MRGSLILSTLLHVAIITIIWIGPFDFGDPIIDPVQVIDVEVVTEIKQRPTEETKPAPEEKPEKTLPKTASLPPPPPPTPPSPPTPPQPAAKPEPKEEPVAVPKKEPEAIPVPKKKPEPEPKKEEVAKPEPVLAPRPRRKPKPPPPPKDDFASVLKTVEKLKHRPRKPDSKPEKLKKDAPSFEDQLSNVLNKHAQQQPSQPAPLGPKMSMSEIDALRRQIERCWNPPVGAPEAENLVVEVKLTINRDGSVRHIQIVDTARMSRDSFYRAAADSVVRAIKSPNCTPLRLPLDKYDLWKDTTLRFDPRELVGRG